MKHNHNIAVIPSFPDSESSFPSTMANLPEGFSRNDEYEAQLYGFSCCDVSAHLKETLLNEIQSSVKPLRTVLLSRQKSEEDKALVEGAMTNFVGKCQEMSKAPLEKLTEQIPSFFSIPSYVLLPSDKVQRKRYTERDEDEEKKRIARLKSRYRRAAYLKSFYEEELAKAYQLENQLKYLDNVALELESLSDLQKKSEKDFKKFHKIVQNVLGLEVREASLKLSAPSSGEKNDMIAEFLFEEYCSSSL